MIYKEAHEFSVTILSLAIGISNCSHDSDFVGNIKGILIAGKSDVGFLLTLWGDQSVNFLNLDVVELGAGSLDHNLGRFLVNQEDKGVAVLNGLDGGLRAEWVLDNSKFIESDDWLHSFQEGFWLSLLGKSSWSLERSSVPDLSFFGGMSSFLHSG